LGGYGCTRGQLGHSGLLRASSGHGQSGGRCQLGVTAWGFPPADLAVTTQRLGLRHRSGDARNLGGAVAPSAVCAMPGRSPAGQHLSKAETLVGQVVLDRRRGDHPKRTVCVCAARPDGLALLGQPRAAPALIEIGEFCTAHYIDGRALHMSVSFKGIRKIQHAHSQHKSKSISDSSK